MHDVIELGAVHRGLPARAVEQMVDVGQLGPVFGLHLIQVQATLLASEIEAGETSTGGRSPMTACTWSRSTKATAAAGTVPAASSAFRVRPESSCGAATSVLNAGPVCPQTCCLASPSTAKSGTSSSL